jgi:hypothetical protein
LLDKRRLLLIPWAMRKKRKESRLRVTRRAFLKRLPTVPVALKWIADKLGGAVVGVLLAEARRFFARPNGKATVKRQVIIAMDGRWHWVGEDLAIRFDVGKPVERGSSQQIV